MTEEEEEEEEEEEKTIVERPISRAFVDCSSVKKRTARSGNVVVGGERKAECIFFPRFNDASESFSLDVLLVAGKLDDDDDDDNERGRRRKKNDENDSLARSFVHFRTDGFVSKPKGGVIYENWYQRAKEALSPRGEGRDDAYYEISIEEKNKKRSGKKKEVGGGGDDDDDNDQDDDDEEVDVKLLVWRFPGEEEERPYSGSCDIKRVAEAPETGTSVAGGDATANAATTKTKTTAATMAVLLELLRHSSAKYIREMEKNVDLKRANECLRRDQELAVKEESRKARDIEQFKRKCLEECLVLVNEKKKRIRELEEILETARKENDALTRKLEKKGGKERRKASSSASDGEDYSSGEDESDEDEGEEEEEEEEEEANTDDEDKDTQVRKRMRQTAMADTIKTTASNGGRKKPKSTTTATTKATASQKQKSKPAARGANTFDALMQANLGRDSDDANSQSSSF
jgi:hypothetical protein